ncbi:MAG TPA: hypothetical protein DEA90_16305 [Opitutae bacterium]|nr:hypothetical protein [Puniceicoccaceae bacterium]HBR95720.1 hypothetical protein [Opitutae bacterium]|tara:strand:+ start:10202 stop:13756 length:3555 start_codon:yes stop_codon:yes gene_type:complete
MTESLLHSISAGIKYSLTLALCLTITGIASRASELIDHGWNARSELSPKGQYIATSDEMGITVYDASSFRKTFAINAGADTIGFFSADDRYYYSVATNQGFLRLDLQTAEQICLAPIKNITRVYSLPESGAFLLLSCDSHYRPTQYALHLLPEGQGHRLLTTLTPEKADYFSEVHLFEHEAADQVLIYASDLIPRKTEWGSDEPTNHRFYELSLDIGELSPLSQVSDEAAYSYGFRNMRPVEAMPQVFEITDGLKGNYDLFNPYTGKAVRSLSVPGVEFKLGAPGVVISKRSVTEDGQTQYFRDYLQSGTLKTIQNLQLPDAETLKQLFDFDLTGPKEDRHWMRLDNKIVEMSRQQNKIVGQYPTEFSNFRILGESPELDRHLILLINGGYGSGDRLALYDIETQESRELPTAPNAIKFQSFAFHPTEAEFFALTSDSEVHAYRMGRSGLSHVNRGPEATSAQFSPDGETLLANLYYDEPGIAVYDPAQFPLDPQNKAIQLPTSPPATVLPNGLQALNFSQSGQWLIQEDSYRAYLNRLSDGELVAILGDHGRPNDRKGRIERQPIAYCLAPDDSAFAKLTTVEEYDMEARKEVSLTYLSATHITSELSDYPEPTWQITLKHPDYQLLDYTPSASQIRVLDLRSGAILQFSSSAGKLSSQTPTELKLTPDPSEELSLQQQYQTKRNPAGSQLAVFDRNTVHCLDLNSGSVQSLPMDNRIQAVHFPAGNQLIAIHTANGKLHFYPMLNVSKDQHAVLSFFNGGKDYLLEAANGQFDASRLIQERGNYQKGVALLPLNQIFEQSFEPNLIGKLMDGIDLPDTPLAFEQITRAPTSEIRHRPNYSDTIQLTVSAHSPVGALRHVQLYQNDKLVKEFDGKAQDRFYQVLELALLPGTNDLRLIATNLDGIASTPATLSVQPPEAANQAIEQRNAKRTLHLLVVGVNEYKNPKYNLNYALPDAESVLQNLSKLSSGLFDAIEVYSVYNLEATSAGIIEQFERVRDSAQPQDSFIFYFAGHGVMSRELQQFYIVPTDVTQIYGAADSLESKGISSRQLRSLAETIQAQKQVFILDACNSGGALEAFNERGASQEKAIAQLARATGTHWITASSGSQFATEFDELGHGAFTYVLLQGLQGKADAGDQRVTVNELKAYLESELPRISKEYKGSPQYPASYGYGRDFPLAVQP